MTIVLTKRRLLLGIAALAVGLLAVGVVARLPLTGLMVGAVLKAAGATQVSFQVTQASPWRVAVEDIGFLLRLQPFAARRITLARTHWWTPSLGTLRVEAARVPVKLEDLAQPSSPPVGADQPGGPARLPFEEISVDGQLAIQAVGRPDQILTVKIEARPAEAHRWEGTTQVEGPGLRLQGEGSYTLGSGDVVFKVPEAGLDLRPWQDFVRQLVPLPEGDWELEGKFSGAAEGRLVGGKLAATGRVRLREGRVASTAMAVEAEGIEADLEFSDIAAVTGGPGTLRVRELRTGKIALGDVAADFSLEGADRIVVTHATLRALGGRVTAEPFTYVPSRAELDAVLLADGISVEEVMALTEDLPAKATGRVDGRVPLRLGADGLRLGTGWLQLKPGAPAEIEFNAKGLLTGGAAPGSPGYAVLEKVESGLLKLKISELRLDIRPTDAPAHRSARLHLKGEPVDPEVKAPVILDLNVNGPLEKLINMGMDSRVSFGTKP